MKNRINLVPAKTGELLNERTRRSRCPGMGHRLRVFRRPCRALAGHEVAVLLINTHL